MTLIADHRDRKRTWVEWLGQRTVSVWRCWITVARRLRVVSWVWWRFHRIRRLPDRRCITDTSIAPEGFSNYPVLAKDVQLEDTLFGASFIKRILSPAPTETSHQNPSRD
jgi:hypothetical protein